MHRLLSIPFGDMLALLDTLTTLSHFVQFQGFTPIFSSKSNYTRREGVNMIVIVSDTLRRDRLGCYGCDWINTPHIDALATKSVVFDKYYIASFPTLPYRADAFTGRYTFAYYGWGPLPHSEKVLSECLSESGYVTQLITDVPHMMNEGQYYDRGFSGWEWIRGQSLDRYQTVANCEIKLPYESRLYRREGDLFKQHLRNTLFRKAEEDYFPARTARTAYRWLEYNYKSDKFFLWVDIFDPHEPWDPPQWYVDMYDPGYDGRVIPHPDYNDCDFLSEKELKHCRALYCGEVTLVDRWVGHLLQKVEDLGLMDNTCIIFTSDHGFYFGEHGKIGKHSVRGGAWGLYEEIVRVPLIIYHPHIDSKRNSLLVQPQDIMPTVLDICDVGIPETVQGKSLLPTLKGSQRPIREVAISTGALYKELPSVETRVSVTDGKWSLVFGGEEKNELYDLEIDPKQGNNLYSKYENIADGLHRSAIDILRSIRSPHDVISKVEALYRT